MGGRQATVLQASPSEGWIVEWEDGMSWMPDEKTARRCAASEALLEALEKITDAFDLFGGCVPGDLEIDTPIALAVESSMVNARAALELARGGEVR